MDTCVWSLALRRRDVVEDPIVRELQALVEEYRVQMIGPIRQEVLSGIRDRRHFRRLRDRLRAFPDLVLNARDYERAAEFFTTCRRRGVQGSNTDFLICSLSAGHEIPIFTTDEDFGRFEKHLPIALYRPG